MRCASSAATRSSIPAPARGSRPRPRGVPRAERAQRGAQVAARPQRDLPEVGLRHDEHVGDLHDPALQELQDIARPGLHDDRDRVGDLGDLGLALPDPDRLDDDDVEGGRERLRGRAGRRREAAEAPAGRRRADEDAAVVGVVGDAGAVGEQRAARAPRRRVDRERGDRAPAGPPRPHELAEQRRLAGAGRPGDPDDVRRRLAAQRRGGDLAQERGDLGARGRRPALHEVERRGRGGQVAPAQPRAEVCSGAAHRRRTLAAQAKITPPSIMTDWPVM